jgi:hypothetical protein
MLDIDEVHNLPAHYTPDDAVRAAARAAVAWRVVRDGWTAQETRDVLEALGIDQPGDRL